MRDAKKRRAGLIGVFLGWIGSIGRHQGEGFSGRLDCFDRRASLYGKSVLARKLRDYWGLPLLSKDQIKENFFDTLGSRGRDHSMELGRKSYERLFQVLEEVLSSKASVILESNFEPHSKRTFLRELTQKFGYQVVEIFLESDPLVLMERFKKRWESGERHRGHLDHERYGDFEERLKGEKLEPFGLAPALIRIDTTHFENLKLDSLIRQISSLCGIKTAESED